MFMIKGTTLTFKKDEPAGTDSFNNAIYETLEVVVDDCLVGPIAPANAREQQAMHQTRGQIEIHLPKLFTGNVGGATVEWDGNVYRLDNDGAVYMPGNTPGRWNRHFKAEYISTFSGSDIKEYKDTFITEDGLHYFITEDEQNYLAQEV